PHQYAVEQAVVGKDTALAYPLLERSGIDPMAKRPDEPGQGEGSACAS
ncbi:hypothetical protein, partial [Pseudomonas aeruginosa]